MSRPILIFGQSGAGKTYSLKNLDPTKTIIIDADKKSAPSWAGWRKNYNKKNFISTNDLDRIHGAIFKVGADEKLSHVENLIIDGVSNSLLTFEATYNRRFSPKYKSESYQRLKEKAVDIIDAAKSQREDLNIVFIGNVTLADPHQPNSVDKLKVPGNYLKDFEVESNFNYVFYAKNIDGEHIFETQTNHSTAKTPEGCFPEIIPNDLAEVIKTIDAYENGT